MSSTRRKFHVKHPVVVDIGCSCRKPKLASLFSLSSFLKQRRSHKYPLSASSSTPTTTTTNTASSFSPSYVTSSPYQALDSPSKPKERKMNKKKGGVVEVSVAVEKESSDPYIDFRDSMLQMIVEKEIYNWDDLRELLHLFLSLNSPYHHHLILHAFTEIWNGKVI